MHRHVPPLVELDKVVQAARALEAGTESAQTLQYLLGQGASFEARCWPCTLLVDVLRQEGASPLADIHALWRRLVFNFLICNTDDHLRNTGFLYDARNHGWRLSPALDLNPMPGDRRESKTWLTEDSGPIDSRDMLREGAPYFRLGAEEAAAIWAEVAQAVICWPVPPWMLPTRVQGMRTQSSR